MNTSEIIKKSFFLPFKAYKGFILVMLLFFVNEIMGEIINLIEIGDFTPSLIAVDLLVNVTILGICIAVVYHYIYDSFDLREVSITETTKAGFKDELIEWYYYSLAIIGTVIISFALGIYHNIYSILDTVLYVDAKLDSMTLPKLIKFLSPDSYHQLASSIIVTLTIFIILFAIFFSYCSFAKIRLKETGDIKESINFLKLTKIIKNKGIKNYLKFVVLTLVVFGLTLTIMRTLEPYFIIGSVVSAFAEAFALFFIIDSYSLFYYADNIN